MHTEFEAKFLEIDIHLLQNTLLALGVSCVQPRTLMKRVVFWHPDPDKSQAYVRVRDEGDKVTFSIKEVTNGAESIDSVKELEVEVSDFDATKAMCVSLGLQQKAYQETYREVWKISNVSFMIDERPGLTPFVEIEAGDEAMVRYRTEQLGYTWGDAVFGAVDEVYHRTYGIDHQVINSMPVLTFAQLPKF